MGVAGWCATIIEFFLLKNIYNFIWQVRYPVLLTPAEKEMAREVCIAFRQAVCLRMWQPQNCMSFEDDLFFFRAMAYFECLFSENLLKPAIWLLVCIDRLICIKLN